jgi:predicted amidohydrolase
MIENYMAVALQPNLVGIRKKEETKINVDHICNLIDLVFHVSALEFPVKLICSPEQALQGFPDSTGGGDLDYVETARGIYSVTVPGEETDTIGEKCKQYKTYFIGCIRASEPDFPDRYFNITFLINPKGKIIYKHHKLQMYPNEPSCTPHDVWDKWVELRGNNMGAFFPIVDTEIGKIGSIMCMDGCFPEPARGLAMNGAEILFRGTFIEHFLGRGVWEVQNRARAWDNSCYVIAPNNGPYYLNADSTRPVDSFGGESMIVDYMGVVIGRHSPATASWCAANIDIKALREYRVKCLFPNLLKDLRTEYYRLIYEEPIMEKNYRLDPTTQPRRRADRVQYYEEAINRLLKRGTLTPPDYTPPPERAIEEPGVGLLKEHYEAITKSKKLYK